MTGNTNHNGGPELDDSPAAAWADHAASLREQAEGLTAITTAEQAEGVGKLAQDAKTALRDMEAAVTAARKPHMDAAKAISEQFRPVKKTLETVVTVTRNLADAWIKAEREREAAEARAAAEAARKADEVARAAAAMADQTDVDQVEAAKAAADAARAAEQAAKEARQQKTTVAGVQMRIVGYDVQITDSRALWKHIAETDPSALSAMLHGWAKQNAKDGPFPGCDVTPIKEAR